MSETDSAYESISQSLGKVFGQIYKDFGKEFIFISGIAVVVFTTQVLLMPKDLFFVGFNWKVALVVIGFSLYWYVISILSVTTFFVQVGLYSPQNPILLMLSSILSHLTFLFGIVLLFLVALPLYLYLIWFPYTVWIHLIYFLIVSFLAGWLFLRSWRLIVKKVHRV